MKEALLALGGTLLAIMNVYYTPNSNPLPSWMSILSLATARTATQPLPHFTTVATYFHINVIQATIEMQKLKWECHIYSTFKIEQDRNCTNKTKSLLYIVKRNIYVIFCVMERKWMLLIKNLTWSYHILIFIID